MNKIFILGHIITMSENRVVNQRWAFLYVHSTGDSKYSQRRVFKNYGPALEMFSRGCNYIDSDFDSYSYVALLWDDGGEMGFRPISWHDNLGYSWNMKDKVNGEK